MESVVATVSGYHGLERFNLIKLLSHLGANYVGAMSRSITHLVCWKFEGRKYNLAKKLKILIVNHRWVEECMKQGRRVPERSYILQSGEEVGQPLLLDVPAKPTVLKKNRHVLSKPLNINDGSGKKVLAVHSEGSDRAVWHDSCSLNEHQMSSSYSSMHLVREKRRIANGNECSVTARPRKSRRLVRKNVKREILACMISDSDQDCSPINVSVPHTHVAAPSNHSDGLRNISTTETRGRFDDGLNSNAESSTDGSRNVGTINDWNHLPPADSSLGVVDSNVSLGRTSHDVATGKNSKDDINDIGTRIPTSMELSCVICWTDFSPTRGVLPCGHRFCYSCIRNWADHMASRRKISTCPLCKASFVTIAKLVDAASSDQKIYSQTVPHSPLSTEIFTLTGHETPNFGAQSSTSSICSECRTREPEDCLISCHVCHIRCIHSYCLDPPLLPWTCIHCKDLQMLYIHNR